MGKQNSDIIEIKLLDFTFTPFFSGRAKIADKKEMEELMKSIKNKGVNLSKGGWFD